MAWVRVTAGGFFGYPCVLYSWLCRNWVPQCSPHWTAKTVRDTHGAGGRPPLVVAQPFQRTLCTSIQVRTRSFCCWDIDWNGGASSWQPVAAALGSPNRSTQLSRLLGGRMPLFQFSNYFKVSYGLCAFQENCSHWSYPMYKSSMQAFAWTYTPLS